MVWAISGLGVLVGGLLTGRGPLRRAGLAALASLYRVVSCIGLGVLLLAGAYVWQRARPAAPTLCE